MIRLSEGWSLTDGILPPLALSEPQGVAQALSEAGVLVEPEKGLGSLACEWIGARRWTYALTFERPEDDRMRAFYMENLCGEGCVRLNGRKLADFSDQDLWAECTEAALPGENRLEVVFEAKKRVMPGCEALPEIGLCGGVFLHESVDARIERLAVETRERELVATCRLSRRRGAEYMLRLRLETEDETLEERELPVRLNETHETVSGELSLRKAPLWSERRPEEGVLRVTAELWRGGEACDRVSLETVRPARPAMRTVQIDASRADAHLAMQMERLGAQACAPLRGRSEYLIGNLAGGLPRTECEPGVPGSAMQRVELLKSLCADAPCWPPEEAVIWRMRARVSDAPPAEVCEAPFETACGYQRAMQAENLRALAEEKRLRGEKMQVRLNDAQWKVASRALLDQDGEPRSAYWTLREAWAQTHVCLREKETGVYEAYLLSDGEQRDVMRARIFAFDRRGRALAQREFVALCEGNSLLGEVQAPFPEGEALLLLRSVLLDSRGEMVEVCDRLAFAQAEEEYRLRALTREECALEETGEGLKNRSETACLCLRAGEKYGFLLPGETRMDARLRGAEWLNTEE